jgi:hypothetical protein
MSEHSVRVRSLSLELRLRLASTMSVLAALILVVGPVRLIGQWADYCQHRFGWTQLELTSSLTLGAAAFFVGYDYKDNHVHIGQLLGGVVAVGAVLTYLILVGRGCGD